MSPSLAEVVQLSERLQTLAQQFDWPEMLRLAQTRQQLLEVYFSTNPLADSAATIHAALGPIQETDKALASLAQNHRQQLLHDAVDLRQRWQMSDMYQRVQNLNI